MILFLLGPNAVFKFDFLTRIHIPEWQHTYTVSGPYIIGLSDNYNVNHVQCQWHAWGLRLKLRITFTLLQHFEVIGPNSRRFIIFNQLII